MKIIRNIVIMLFVALLAVSCKDEFFTIEGTFVDGGTQNIRVMYVTDYETLQSEWVTMTDGHFEVTGMNQDWTVVYIVNSRKEIIARAAVKDGDKMEIAGSMSDTYHTAVAGNDATEEWNRFMVENAALYMMPDRTQLNRAIEKYVTSNPDRISSTLLLLNDYANIQGTTSVDSLFKRISMEARPAGLVNNYFALSQQLDKEKSDKNVPSVMLYNSEDTITTITMARFKATLLYFWDKRDSQRRETVKDLKELYSRHGGDDGRLQVVDIMMSPDTTRWKKTLEGDSATWKHYWAPGGTLSRNLVNMSVEGTPYFILVTSVGKQLYRGSSLSAVIEAADKQMAD